MYIENEIVEEEVLEEEIELTKNKEAAQKRKLDRTHKIRKQNIEKYKTMGKTIAHGKTPSQCPKEKRLRKKVCNRKARYSEDELNFNSYKKCGRMA